jgi:GNAT superfamily N-acetyltransferase
VSITAETLARDGFGPRPEFRVLIADLDNQPAGYAFFFNCYSTFRGRGLFLEDLFVRPKFRGKKVGDALLSHVAACFGHRDVYAPRGGTHSPNTDITTQSRSPGVCPVDVQFVFVRGPVCRLQG